jgi:hypothetical protein
MAEAQHEYRRPHRPFGVTLVLLGVFLIGLANGWRALGLIRQSSLLLERGAGSDPRLCAAVSVAWSLVFLSLAYALWRRKLISRVVVPVASLAYGLNRLVWPGPCPPASWPQEEALVATLIFVAGSLFVTLALNVASGRNYFRPAGERLDGGHRESP